jgi:hypothetical protein
MNWIAKIFRRLDRYFAGHDDWSKFDTVTGTYTPVSQTEEGKLFATIMENECPDCHHHGFYGGPEGGCSQNIFCANRDCRAGFNITSIIKTAERIGVGDISRYPKLADPA